MLYRRKCNSTPPLFEAVGCVCLYKGKILLLKRLKGKPYPEHWGLPGGKREENEFWEQAIIRELFEETGIRPCLYRLSLVKTYHIILKKLNFLYTIYQFQMDSMPSVRISLKEHSKFGWFEIEEALNLKLYPYSRPCIRDAVKTASRPFNYSLLQLAATSIICE